MKFNPDYSKWNLQDKYHEEFYLSNKEKEPRDKIFREEEERITKEREGFVAKKKEKTKIFSVHEPE